MNLAPDQIQNLPLTALRAAELHLFADTIRLAYEADPQSCQGDSYLQEQIAALYLVAYYGRPAAGADITAVAKGVFGVRLNLDAIDLLGIQWLLAA